MYCKKAILFCLIFTGLHCFSQQEIVNDGISIIPVKLFGTNYKDYVIIDKEIYAVTNADSLIIFNIESNQVKSVISGVVAVAKTSENTLYSLDNEGTLSETKRFNKTEKIENIKGQFAKMVDSINKCEYLFIV